MIDTLKFVTEVFGGMKDRAGEPYIKHLKRVADGLGCGSYADVYKSALLHDILEDCPEWNEKSLGQLFGGEIANTVVILTKEPGEKYEDYIDRIATSDNYSAIRIKISDLKDNMNITRLPEITDKDIERLKKYHKAYTKLVNL